ncbi:uroporphyrinogen-III C-methyltransferase [Cupriavidus alkaliphilus]|uniref:uroporphyrinogen-III C-methyltransferase n=1 Tax=Cupriavidus alkaliphilus TaxID=942866 RepID=UPI0008154AAB|nr:uroporphyrinogen-III C-methyltransferase [Cupriavidus alkaliphilus]SCB26640.1 uroporphyrinogen-III C-methyltransferase [Cupriavidus alkaliphilus]
MQAPLKPGKVWLVGVGPGSPDLVTVRAMRALAAAEVWLVDDLVSPEMASYASPGTHVEWVGKRGGRCSVSQQRIQQLTLQHALAGRTVARVKGGDPLLFGRGGEEAAFLRGHGLQVEIVNGISSGMAAAQALGIALTHRAHCHGVTFVTGHTSAHGSPDWHALARGGTTLVIYMGMSRIAAIRDGLLAAGMAAGTPAAVVMHAGSEHARSWTGSLGTLAQALAAGLASPAVIVVGAVVGDANALLPVLESDPVFLAEAATLCTAAHQAAG